MPNFSNWTAVDFAVAVSPIILLYLARALPRRVDQLIAALHSLGTALRVESASTREHLGGKFDSQTDRLNTTLVQTRDEIAAVCRYGEQPPRCLNFRPPA